MLEHVYLAAEYSCAHLRARELIRVRLILCNRPDSGGIMAYYGLGAAHLTTRNSTPALLDCRVIEEKIILRV